MAQNLTTDRKDTRANKKHLSPHKDALNTDFTADNKHLHSKLLADEVLKDDNEFLAILQQLDSVESLCQIFKKLSRSSVDPVTIEVRLPQIKSRIVFLENRAKFLEFSEEYKGYLGNFTWEDSGIVVKITAPDQTEKIEPTLKYTSLEASIHFRLFVNKVCPKKSPKSEPESVVEEEAAPPVLSPAEKMRLVLAKLVKGQEVIYKNRRGKFTEIHEAPLPMAWIKFDNGVDEAVNPLDIELADNSPQKASPSPQDFIKTAEFSAIEQQTLLILLNEDVAISDVSLAVLLGMDLFQLRQVHLKALLENLVIAVDLDEWSIPESLKVPILGRLRETCRLGRWRLGWEVGQIVKINSAAPDALREWGKDREIFVNTAIGKLGEIQMISLGRVGDDSGQIMNGYGNWIDLPDNPWELRPQSWVSTGIDCAYDGTRITWGTKEFIASEQVKDSYINPRTFINFLEESWEDIEKIQTLLLNSSEPVIPTPEATQVKLAKLRQALKLGVLLKTFSKKDDEYFLASRETWNPADFGGEVAREVSPNGQATVYFDTSNDPPDPDDFDDIQDYHTARAAWDLDNTLRIGYVDTDAARKVFNQAQIEHDASVPRSPERRDLAAKLKQSKQQKEAAFAQNSRMLDLEVEAAPIAEVEYRTIISGSVGDFSFKRAIAALSVEQLEYVLNCLKKPNHPGNQKTRMRAIEARLQKLSKKENLSVGEGSSIAGYPDLQAARQLVSDLEIEHDASRTDTHQREELAAKLKDAVQQQDAAFEQRNRTFDLEMAGSPDTAIHHKIVWMPTDEIDFQDAIESAAIEQLEYALGWLKQPFHPRNQEIRIQVIESRIGKLKGEPTTSKVNHHSAVPCFSPPLLTSPASPITSLLPDYCPGSNLNLEQAKKLVDAIRGMFTRITAIEKVIAKKFNVLRTYIYTLYEGEGYKLLGYRNITKLFKSGELGEHSRSKLQKEWQAARVEREALNLEIGTLPQDHGQKLFKLIKTPDILKLVYEDAVQSAQGRKLTGKMIADSITKITGRTTKKRSKSGWSNDQAARHYRLNLSGFERNFHDTYQDTFVGLEQLSAASNRTVEELTIEALVKKLASLTGRSEQSAIASALEDLLRNQEATSEQAA